MNVLACWQKNELSLEAGLRHGSQTLRPHPQPFPVYLSALQNRTRSHISRIPWSDGPGRESANPIASAKPSSLPSTVAGQSFKWSLWPPGDSSIYGNQSVKPSGDSEEFKDCEGDWVLECLWSTKEKKNNSSFLDLEIIMLSKVSHIEKVRNHMTSLIWFTGT